MSEQEYYVRQPDSENARGPFSMDKLQSLAEAGQVDRESLYYDDEAQDWRPVGDNAALCESLFPEKKKLTLRKREDPTPDLPGKETAPKATPPVTGSTPDAKASKNPTPSKPVPPPPLDKANEKDSERSGLNVEDILSAAEGNTDEMEFLRIQRKWRDRAVALSLPMMALLMLLSAASLLGFFWKDISALYAAESKADMMVLLEQPLLVLGLVDLFFAILLALAVTKVYPLLRLRLMLGLGFMGYLAYATWAAGATTGLLELLALFLFSTGIYVCTLTLSFPLMLISGLCAFAGIAAYGLMRLFPNLLP